MSDVLGILLAVLVILTAVSLWRYIDEADEPADD